jgi:DNA-binding Xre family transcriptional regulator
MKSRLEEQMSNEGRDLSRGRKLTPEEAARYKKIREEVMDEFPPVTTNAVCAAITKLRELREQQGLSLADMEARTGMTRANICRLENERRNVQLRTLERYARALGCRVEVGFVPVQVVKKQTTVA